MATLRKVTTTQWVDAAGKRVKPNSPGATKRTIVSRKWYIVAKVNGRVQRIAAYTDKKASQTKLAAWLRAQERGEVGLIDPYRMHLDRPIVEHLQDYLPVLRSRSRSADYHAEVERTIKRVVATCKIEILRHLSADVVQQYLAGLDAGATTKNRHRSYLVTFCNYLVATNRLPTNPITSFAVARAKPRAGEEKRERRALTPKELRRLLAAVRDYPLAVAAFTRGGRPRRDGAGGERTPRPTKLTVATTARLEQRGRERHLLYKLAVVTGLRRGELSRVMVKHLDLGPRPMIDLPGTATKNGKRAKIPLPPAVAEEVREWLAATGRGPEDRLLVVPPRNNLSRLHRAHLKLAGIEYRDARGRYCDFHALRKCANAYLRRCGVPAKERQLFLTSAFQETQRLQATDPS